MKVESAQAKRDEERTANTAVGFEPRRSDRFMAAGEAGVPISKNRLAESIRAGTEARAKELYNRIMLHRRAGIPVAYDKAELGNLLGYSVKTIHEYEDYFNSEECVFQRFLEKGTA